MNGLAIFLIIFLFLILIGGGIVLGIYLFDKRKKDKQKGSGKNGTQPPTQTQPPSNTLPVCKTSILTVKFANPQNNEITINFSGSPSKEPPFDNYTVELSDNNFRSISYRATFTEGPLDLLDCSALCTTPVQIQEFTPPIPSSVDLTSLSLRLITNSCRSNIVPITPFN